MDDLVAYKGFFCASYHMDEPYKDEDLDKMIPEVVSRKDAQNIILSNPFICANRLCFNVKRNGQRVVFDSSGALYPVRYDRFRGTSNFIHPTEGIIECTLYDIYGSDSIYPVSSWDMYQKLYGYLKSKLFFLTRDQIIILVAFVMYQWVAPYSPLKFNLQIASYHNQWLAHIFSVLLELTPRGMKNNGEKEISSILYTDTADAAHMALAPHIFLTILHDADNPTRM